MTEAVIEERKELLRQIVALVTQARELHGGDFDLLNTVLLAGASDIPPKYRVVAISCLVDLLSQFVPAATIAELALRNEE